MKRALFLTAMDRPHYLAQTLASWERVTGLADWHLVFRIEPSEQTAVIRDLIESFIVRMDLIDVEVIVNPTRYGVLHHPWVGFEALFEDYDFVVRAEDDLVVSSDILAFFEVASRQFRDTSSAAAVVAYTEVDGPEDMIVLSQAFSPWVWGTWKDRWTDLIRDSWDHDYSTFNGTPGNQAGWDWNLNTRVFPDHGLSVVAPMASRANNIGVSGVHGTPENFVQSASFREFRDPLGYHDGSGILF